MIDWLILMLLLKMREEYAWKKDDELERIIEPAAGLRLEDVLRDKRPPKLRVVK